MNTPVASGAASGGRSNGSRRSRASHAASHLSSASDEAATSLLPGLLSATLGASPLALGIIEGVASAVDGAARLGGGALSEEPRRRPLISAGSYTTMAALTGLIALATSALQVGLLRAGASAARGLRSPQRYAEVPQHVGSQDYGRAFGVERGVHNLVAVAGPLLAFVALTMLGTRPAILVTIVPGVVAVVIGIWLVRTAPPAPPRAARPLRLRLRAVYRGRLGTLMTGITMFEVANFAAVLLILRATKLLERRDVPFGATAMAVLLYLFWRLAAAASSVLAGRMIDRRGHAPVMSAGILLLLAAYAGFAFVDGTVPQLFVCFLGAGAASGAIDVAEHVGVARLAASDLRWSALGSLSAVRSAGRLVATVGATAVWTALGPQWGLLLASPFMLGAAAVMAFGEAGPDFASLSRRVRPVVMPIVVVLLVLAAVVLLLASGALRIYR